MSSAKDRIDNDTMRISVFEFIKQCLLMFTCTVSTCLTNKKRQMISTFTPLMESGYSSPLAHLSNTILTLATIRLIIISLQSPNLNILCVIHGMHLIMWHNFNIETSHFGKTSKFHCWIIMFIMPLFIGQIGYGG